MSVIAFTLLKHLQSGFSPFKRQVSGAGQAVIAATLGRLTLIGQLAIFPAESKGTLRNFVCIGDVLLFPQQDGSPGLCYQPSLLQHVGSKLKAHCCITSFSFMLGDCLASITVSVSGVLRSCLGGM